MRRVLLASASVVLAVSCGDSVPPLATAKAGVVFTFPIDGQNDVPTGARVVVAFSDPIEKDALGPCTATSGAFCVVGPNGPVDAMPTVSEDGATVSFSGALEPGTTYQVFARSELAPFAENLPASGMPLFSFTTRTDRPRAAVPTLVSVNGGDPTKIGTSFRPMFESTTLRLLFSEPLDPRTIKLAAGGFELLDSSGGVVPALIVSEGIHVSIDPKQDLTPGATYTLRLGNQIADLGGQTLAPVMMQFSPTKSRGDTPVVHVMKTRQDGDPGPSTSRAGAKPNTIEIDKPLIGHETSAFTPATLVAELGDPKALGGPISFTLRKGQRLSTTPLSIKLGGSIPSGLETGDIQIELLTDATGRLYRNPYQPAEQRPENARAPLYVDLSMDVAIFAKDPKGNAVMTQTVLGMQATGTAIATDGALVIETVSSMELGLLGVTKAPSNLVLSLYTQGPGTPPSGDTDAPTLVASSPGQSEAATVDQGIELTFSEPIDLDRARAGGIKLQDTAGTTDIPIVIESHGAGIVVRPLQPLAYGKIYRVVMSDVADVAGNKATIPNMSFTTPVLSGTDIPGMVVAIHPGVPCALTGATPASPGRCSGGDSADELYKPFTLGANEPVEVAFSEPIRRSSVTRGTQCGQGSVRIEETDASGTCTGVVAGTLITRERTLTFVPDVPWVEGKHYKLTLNSGGNDGCDNGELCDLSSAMNFDPLAGMGSGDGGGPALVIPFTATPAGTGTYMMNTAAPFTDINGSGTVESSELKFQDNRALMRITSTDGSINSATFSGNTCDATSVNNKEGCTYLLGAMPVVMGEVSSTCPLAGGQTAASCIPVTMSAQAMYGTTLTMSAATNLATLSSDTNTQVMRIREPAGGAVVGYIVDNGGTPKLVVGLDLYMDAPDMSILFSSHDLHSKPLSVVLEGPVAFLPDGRISIALSNTADVPVTVSVSGPQSGHVKMVIPMGEMKLQLVSPAPRGVSL